MNQFVTNNVITIPCGVTSIDTQFQLYESKSNINQIIIPDTVVTIGENAFIDYYTTSEIVIPESVQTVGKQAFRNTGIISVIFPNSIKVIEENTFLFSDNIEIIGISAFSQCNKLKSVTIPKSIQQIQNSAFSYCAILQCVAIQNEDCEVDPGAFTVIDKSIIKKGEQYTCQDPQYQQCDEQYEYIMYKGYVNYCLSEENVQFYYQDEQGLKYKVDNCKQHGTYFKGDNPPYQCISQCNEDQYYQLYQENGNDLGYKCQDNCVDGYAAPLNAKEYQNGYGYCTKECPEQAKYIINGMYGQCSSTCTGNYSIPISGNQCSTTCKYYTNSSGDNICVTSCPDEFPYTIQYSVRQCLNNCSGQNTTYINEYTKQCCSFCISPQRYVQENYCVPNCTGNYAQNGSNYICINNCTYYTQDDANYCTDQCGSSYPYQTIQNPPHCLENCEGQEIYKFANEYINPKECTDDCSRYQEQSYNINENDIKLCIPECPFNETYLYIQNMQCVSQCQTPNIYIFESQCVISCMNTENKFVKIQNSDNLCVKDCEDYVWYNDQNNQQICSEQKQCQENEIMDQNTKQCQCQQEFPYIQNNVCVEKCSDEYAKPAEDTSKVCSNECNFKIISQEPQQLQCISQESCQDSEMKSQYSEARFQCVTKCSESLQTTLIYVLDKQCVASCGKVTDSESDKVWYINAQQDRQCVDSASCQDIEGEYLSVENSVQCVTDCATVEKLQQDKTCIQACTGDYATPVEGKVCSKECNFKLGGDSTTKQCVVNNECEAEQYQSQYNQQRIQCVDQCSESLNEKAIYYLEQQCVEDCGTINDQHRVWYQDKNRNICRQTTECNTNIQPPEYEQVEIYKCIHCDSEYKYISDNNCVISCSLQQNDKTFVKNDQYVCTNSCGYDQDKEGEYVWYQLNNEKQCTDFISCDQIDQQDQQKYEQKENTNECQLNECYNKQFIIIDQENEYCVSQCPKDIWKVQNEKQICIDICFYALEIITGECQQSLSQCKQEYHIETQYKNSECAYIVNAENCNVYDNQQYSNSIYSMKDNEKLCTSCSENNEKVKMENGINKCFDSNNMSSGKIAAIIIGSIIGFLCILCIVIVILRKIIQKKRSQQQMTENVKI